MPAKDEEVQEPKKLDITHETYCAGMFVDNRLIEDTDEFTGFTEIKKHVD